jgi:dihydroorotate dehydrogenase
MIIAGTAKLDAIARKIGDLSGKLLRCLPAETAHEVAMFGLRNGFHKWLPRPEFFRHPGLQTDIPQIGRVAHPIGLAAGFDKNAVCLSALTDFGFSFLEAGTVTPQPQPGNLKPRLFRLPGSLDLINRMGFNNQGSEAVARNVQEHGALPCPLGINVGKNKTTHPLDAIEDYVKGAQIFQNLAKYLVANVSSPNTEGLRDLATKDFVLLLSERLADLKARTWIKLDPDMSRKEFQILIEAVVETSFAGVILTNTHKVSKPHAGGMSGHSLAMISTKMLEWAYHVHKGSLPMIASGGILTGSDVFQKLIRGASAVQIYSAFVYRGPWAVCLMLEELFREMQLRRIEFLSDAIGKFYDPDF